MMVTLTPAQADLLEALDLYWRAYDRGLSYNDLRVLTGADDRAIGDMIFTLSEAWFIEYHRERYSVTARGRNHLRKLGRYPFDPDPIRPRPDFAAGTFEARP